MYKGLLGVKQRVKGGKYRDEKTQDRDSTQRPRSRRASIVESLYESTVLSIEEENKQKHNDISDFQWKMEREKIGISENSKTVKLANLIYMRKKNKSITFIQENFNRKECVHYVHHDTEWNATMPRHKPCFCGGVESDHQTKGKVELLDQMQSLANTGDEKDMDPGIVNKALDLDDETPIKSDRPWTASTAILEFTTNAYGTIEFGENLLKAAKYVRLADNSRMTSVKEFIVKYWNLTEHRPYLALSIVGGAKNFKMDGRNKEKFKAGMIAATRATNAWVLTSGTNTGVMKLVGEAVNDGQFLITEGDKIKRGLKAIGICPWGYIHGNNTLINENASEFNNVRYETNVEIKTKEPSPLNPHHTHFLMVDDGNRNIYGGYGLRNFKSEFEKMLMEPEPAGLGIPVVTLLLEGGTDAIFEVKENLAKGKPCVVIGGSGRAADILAYAQRNTIRDLVSGTFSLREGHIRHVENMLEESYGDKVTGILSDGRKKKFMTWIMECISYSDLIIVFDINKENNLDKKILSALLIGDDLTVQSQMYLSMVWNRVDIAEEKVFKNRNLVLHETDLYEVMIQSLLIDRMSFVELLVMNGFSMHKFLNVQRLRDLYNDAVIQHPHLLVQIERRVGPCTYIYLSTIHKLLIFFMKSHSHPLYEADIDPEEEGSKELRENCLKAFDLPFLELFIWSVLCNKPNLRSYFWAKSGSPLVAALFASSFYKTLTHLYKLSDTEQVRELKNEFLDKANHIMEIAYTKDQGKAMGLAEKKVERFGSRSLIKLSFISNLKSFIGNHPCQRIVQGTWRRGFWKIEPLMIILSIFCPLLVSSSAFTYIPLGDDGGPLDLWQKMYVFYRAPIVKYTSNLISYIFFLLLYTSVALFNFEWQYQDSEIVLYVWLLILILDELRELFSQPYSGCFPKLQGHLSNVWNKFDFIISFVAVLGFILKNYQLTFQVSRVLFAINCSLLYIRLFRVYHASWRLGPKLVVFQRMIPELVTFMLLLIIFILGYGTATQALLNPVREFHIEDLPQMIANIVYLPYWQMYGELSLESMENQDKTVCYEEDFCEDFTVYNHVTIFFLAIYMLVGNVMLLNLLIAIFTSVFEDVRENSKEVWKFEMYRLVEEYDRKPVLPVPFTIFEELYKLFRQILRTTCRREKENVDLTLARKIETLDLLENDSLNAYIIDKSEEENCKIKKKMSVIEEKMTKVLEYLDGTEKDDDRVNDWGEEFPAGVTPYSASSESNQKGKLQLNKITSDNYGEDESPSHMALEEGEEVADLLETSSFNTEQQISTRMKTIEESIADLEKNSSKALLKMDEIFLLMKKITNKSE